MTPRQLYSLFLLSRAVWCRVNLRFHHARICRNYCVIQNWERVQPISDGPSRVR
jgi:hypothetical protein